MKHYSKAKVSYNPLSTYAILFEEISFVTPRNAYVSVRISGYEMLVFRKVIRTYQMKENMLSRKVFGNIAYNAKGEL